MPEAGCQRLDIRGWMPEAGAQKLWAGGDVRTYGRTDVRNQEIAHVFYRALFFLGPLPKKDEKDTN